MYNAVIFLFFFFIFYFLFNNIFFQDDLGGAPDEIQGKTHDSDILKKNISCLKLCPAVPGYALPLQAV